MRLALAVVSLCALLTAATLVQAQRPGGGGPPPGGGPPGGGGERAVSKAEDVDELVSRMLAFDKDKDGQLSRSEIGDERLLRLFDRADANKDGVVTKAELTALAEKEHAEGRGFGGGPGGPGGPGGGPGGPGGPMMGMPRPGEVLAAPLQQMLKLTDEQKSEIEALQKDVNARLDKILNDEQRQQLKQMRERRPGPGGRFGGPGGPGGPPPGRP